MKSQNFELDPKFVGIISTFGSTFFKGGKGRKGGI